jgi:hypothetical protein
MSDNIIITTPPAIHGEQVAGESAKLRKELEGLIGNINKSQFDVASLLYQTKLNKPYVEWGFSTFVEYVKTLTGIKESKARYLTTIAETFTTVGIPRETYEPLGITRCRYISSLDPTKDWTNPDTGAVTPIAEFIKGFVEKGEEIKMDLLKQHVRTLKGISGDNDISFRNLKFQRLVAENTWDKAIELAKHNAGSVGKDSEGMSLDISDEYAAEIMAIAYLNDGANNGSLVDTEEEADE